MIWINLPTKPSCRVLILLLVAVTAAEWLGPVLAGALGAPLLRLAAGGDPSPAGGALEAGLVGSAIWLAFEA